MLEEHGNTVKSIKTIVLIDFTKVWGSAHLIFPSPNGEVSFDNFGVWDVKYLALRTLFIHIV